MEKQESHLKKKDTDLEVKKSGLRKVRYEKNKIQYTKWRYRRISKGGRKENVKEKIKGLMRIKYLLEK